MYKFRSIIDKFDYLSCLAFTVLFEKYNQNISECPEWINEYRLVEDITLKLDKPKMANYAVGIYEKNRTKFIAKIWNRKFKGLDHRLLIKEYQNTKLINESGLEGEHNGFVFKYPEASALIEQNGSLIYISKYLNGKKLKDFDLKYQKNIINSYLEYMRNVNINLLKGNQSEFDKYGYKFFVLSLIPISTYLILQSPKNFLNIIKMSKDAVIDIFRLRSQNLVLSHRDLTPNNILVNGNQIYIIDLATVALTYPEYDEAYSDLMFRFNSVKNSLTKFLSLHLSCKTVYFDGLNLVPADQNDK